MTKEDPFFSGEQESFEILPCSICGGDIEHHRTPEGKVFWTEGHNAQPVTNGRCCDDCNNLVIAARISDIFSQSPR
jgi:hypothetical protein